MGENKDINVLKSLGKNTLDTLVEKYVPIWGDILTILNKTNSEIEINERFKPLEEKLSKIKGEDLNKLEALPDVEKILTKEDLTKLINLYLRANVEQRRKYLANAIYNVTTLNNTDYQHNSFFITILSTIPDISIEFLMNWKRNEGVADEEFKTLQKKYKTEITDNEIIKNCESNGLLERYDKTDRTDIYNPSKYVWVVTALGSNFREFISGD